MPSVAERIYTALECRLRQIRGGAYCFDLQGRVFMQRPSYDLDVESTPAVFIAPRPGSGFRAEQRPGTAQFSDMTLTFDVVGIVANTKTAPATVNGLRLMADLQRALEQPADLFLSADVDGDTMNLLSQELRMIDAQFETPPDQFPFEVVGIGIECTYPHCYGDPDHV